MAIAILTVMARDKIAQAPQLILRYASNLWLRLLLACSSKDAISFRAAISACEGGNCWKEAGSFAFLCNSFQHDITLAGSQLIVGQKLTLKIAGALVRRS